MPAKTRNIAKRKRIIVDRLRTGDAPGPAARRAGISRNEAYTWRREDEAFAAAWEEAVQEGIDKLEVLAFRRAVKGNDRMLELYLKCRRPEVWNPNYVANHPSAADTNHNLKMTLLEALMRVENLGLPAPVIEYDFDNDVDKKG